MLTAARGIPHLYSTNPTIGCAQHLLGAGIVQGRAPRRYRLAQNMMYQMRVIHLGVVIKLTAFKPIRSQLRAGRDQLLPRHPLMLPLGSHQIVDHDPYREHFLSVGPREIGHQKSQGSNQIFRFMQQPFTLAH